MMFKFYKKLGFIGKVLLPVMVILPLGMLFQIGYIKRSAEKTIVESSILSATSMIEQFKLLRGYYTENVIKKIKSQNAMEVSFDHEGKQDTVPLPATMIHDLSKKFETGDSGVRLRLYSEYPFPHRTDRVLDEFSKSAITYLKANPTGTLTRVVSVSGKEAVRVAIADRMTDNACVQCHNSHPQSPFKSWKLGDVRGVLEVEVPTHKQMAATQAMVTHIGGFNGGTTALLCLIIVMTVLYQVIRPVREIVEELRQEVGKSVQQGATLTSAASELSTSVSTQASAIQESVSTLDEINAMATRSVDGAKQSMGMVKDNQETASKGKNTLNQVVGAIGEIDTSNQSIVSQMEEGNQKLGEIIRIISEIGVKTKVINDIVFQTKLLSFNASVEAARAGEHGKGFAVVAEEVGNLAQMSGNAAKEISDMLDGSIRKVEEIVNETKGKVNQLVLVSRDKIQAGTLTAKNCGEVIEAMVIQATRVNHTMQEVCTASEEQARGVSGISKAMGQLDGATHRNASFASQTSQVSKDLLEQAEVLRQLVLRFEAQAFGAKHAQDEDASKAA